MYYSRNIDMHFRELLGRKVSATRCFGNCPQWDTVLMIWPENGEIMTTLLVKDPFTEMRVPHVHRPRLDRIKKQ